MSRLPICVCSAGPAWREVRYVGAVSTIAQQDWRRPGPTREQQRRDVLVGIGILVGAAVSAMLINSMGLFTYGAAPSLAEQLGWAVALTLPLMWRRRYPEAVVIVVGGFFIAAQVRQNGDNLMPSVALFIAMYTLGAWGKNRVVARWVRIAVIAAMFGWLTYGFIRALMRPPMEFEGASGPLDPFLAAVIHQVLINLLFFLGGYFLGNVAWLSAWRQHELEVRAEQLRASREENARQAVVAERVRIARDLHDVVAHHVSVMGVQAAAARRVIDTDVEVSRGALETVEQTARTAIAELRGLLGVLRAEPPVADGAVADGGAGTDVSARSDTAQVATPGLSQIPDLVAETQRAGVRVDYAVYGDAQSVPSAIALSAYRVVQESLTNSLKYAGGAPVDVRLRFGEDWLEVEVTDAGRRVVAAAGSGLGIVGMRERVAVHGGEFEAGPRPSGGYRVRASFPLDRAGGDQRVEQVAGSTRDMAE